MHSCLTLLHISQFPPLSDNQDHWKEKFSRKKAQENTKEDGPPTSSENQKSGQHYPHFRLENQSDRPWLMRLAATLAVLSPYRSQVELLRKALRNHFGMHPDFNTIDILTVHQAQGREWDTIFFSVSDGKLQGNAPWFADTSNTQGRLLVNTAISRAKRYLRIFCDRDFWAQRDFPRSLLSEISTYSHSP
jgi:superfamily I DNA and/or RNA helicase